jgi:exodeoxyribonuclease VII large subunit
MNFALDTKPEESSEYTVSQLSSLIKRKIEDNFGFVKVRGEISGLKIASSGHGYFNLKDQDAVLACTCWKPIMMRIPFKLEDGMEVIVTGRITTFASQSKYQISAEKIEAAGAGALMEILLKRKEMLAKEGLFDESRKKAIPMLPRKIGIITSPVGAVIQDIIHRVKDRCPVNLLLWPVAVQGEACAFEVSSAINGFNQMSLGDRPDVIIVARGGGSIEDLWGFNEEIVVRAAANSIIPIISAVGHETDFTLIDFASDKRAPTPTAAAEFATPVMVDIKNKINDFSSKISMILYNKLESVKTRLELIYKSFSIGEKLLFAKYQKLDDLSFRLKNSLPNNLNIKTTKLDSIKLPISAISNLVERKRIDCKNLYEKCNSSMRIYIHNLSQKFELNSKLIESMGINKILNRGFAIIRSDKGEIIKNKLSSSNHKKLSVEWMDGKIEVEKI